ncbi:hypothetical protein FHY29_003390 [Xanthomonas arboricola]|uniref:hypothetical protein n=1 Tax=Xanthomonas arboricola TaxID=56448 RepID=UPI0011AFF2F4|nr:hypothetical protein [Xanthomonas arboricola]
MSTLSTQKTIEKYFSSTVQAVGDLYEKELYGPALVVAYSAMDTLGILDAPTDAVVPAGVSFKNWATKYYLKQESINFSAVDLWAARCAVLHTSTSESDLSRAGKAKQLQYYNGDSSHPIAREFVARVQKVGGGEHIAVNFLDLFSALVSAMNEFAPKLFEKCERDPASAARLRKVLQLHVMPATL